MWLSRCGSFFGAQPRKEIQLCISCKNPVFRAGFGQKREIMSDNNIKNNSIEEKRKNNA
jgi:hypothetical protein